MARLVPKLEVIRRLFALSGNVCAFPECTHALINSSGTLIAQVCHIEAAEEGGERFNISQSDEDRRAFENLMIMCYQHHIETNDVNAYTAPILKKIKKDHEAKFTDNKYELPAGMDQIIVKDIKDKLDKIHGAVSENRTLIKEGNQTAKENQEYLSTLLEMLQNLQQGKILNVDESTIYTEQLDFIKQLRNEKKVGTALNAAIQFKKNKWEQINEELKFKVLANIASILFELGRQKEAAEYLLELQNVNYENGETQAYIALAYSILQDSINFEKSFANAIKINDKSINLWVAYIYSRDEKALPEDINKEIPDEMKDKAEILFALGEAYIQRGLESEGFEMMEKSLILTEKLTNSLWQVKGIYAVRKLVTLITIEKIAFNKFSKQELVEISQAVDKISEVWEFIKNTELAANGWYILMNRGIAYKVLGQIGKADWDLEEGFRLSNKFEPFRNLVLHYLETNRFEKAEELLNLTNGKWINDNEDFEYHILRARFFIMQGKVDVAIDFLLPHLTNDKIENNLRLLDLITLIYFQGGAYGKALPFAIQMTDNFSNFSNGYLAAAICYSRIGEVEKALEKLGTAIELVDNSLSQRSLNIFQIAEEYRGLKQYDKAAKCYEKILNEDIYNTTFKNLTLTYFYGNELEKCIALCLKARVLSPGDSIVDEILFRTYEELGEYQQAEEVLFQHFQSSDVLSFDHFRLLGIQLFKKTGKHDKALQLSLEIAVPQKLTLPQRMGVSSILLENGQISAGLSMAYEARLDNYEQSEAHVMYLQTLAIRPKDPEESIFPETISLETAFIVQDKASKELTFFLTEDKRMSGAEILRPKDSLAPKAIGKQIGDVIEMHNNFGVGNKLTIVAIFNRYTYSFRDSQKLLETKYADESGMKFFNGGNGGIEAMQEFIRTESIKANAQKKELYNFYKNSAVTIGMLACYQFKTLVEVWFDMMAPDIGPILCYNHDENGSISGVADNDIYAILDCLTLLSCFMLLRRQEILNNLNFKWAVAMSTLEELQTYRDGIQRKGPTISVGVEDGELRHGETTQEHINKQVQDIDQIVDWCNANALVRTPKRIPRSIGETENVADVIGQSCYDTLLLASEINGAVVSDDEKFKALAFQEYGLQTFSTYQILVYNVKMKLITHDEFVKCYRSLIRHNYTFIPISGIDLWDLFDENNFKVQFSFVTAVKGLLVMRPEVAAMTITDFAKRVYLNLTFGPSRAGVLSFIYRSTRAHRDWQKVRAVIKIVSLKHFELMPSQREEFLALVDID